MFDDIFPSQYMKKPVIIQAAQLTPETYYKIAAWCGGTVTDNAETLLINTLEGQMTAKLGDYIVRGVEGEFYPVAVSIFHKTYSEVEVKSD